MNIDDLSLTEKIKAASKGEAKLVDEDGCVFWIDTYSPKDETAYIHTADGENHLVGWDHIEENFEFIPADNSHLKKNEYRYS